MQVKTNKSISTESYYDKNSDNTWFWYLPKHAKDYGEIIVSLEANCLTDLNDYHNQGYYYVDRHAIPVEVFYIEKNQATPVTIMDKCIFLQTLMRYMENNTYSYTYRSLNCDVIHELFTSNGGHKPSKIYVSDQSMFSKQPKDKWSIINITAISPINIQSVYNTYNQEINWKKQGSAVIASIKVDKKDSEELIKKLLNQPRVIQVNDTKVAGAFYKPD